MSTEGIKWNKNTALEHLEANFTNSESPVYQLGAHALHKYYQKVLSYKELYNFLRSHDTYTAFREIKTSKKNNPVYVYKPRQVLKF